MMFFSATYEPEVMKFAEIIVNNPLIIRLLKEEESLDNIKQYYVRCKDLDEKYAAITNIYGVITIGQAIIFCHVRYFNFPRVTCINKLILHLACNIYRLEKRPTGWQRK